MSDTLVMDSVADSTLVSKAVAQPSPHHAVIKREHEQERERQREAEAEAEAEAETEIEPGASTGLSSSSSNGSEGNDSINTPCNSSSNSNTPGIVPIPRKSRIIKTDRPRPYLCPTCTRGFARQEHLKRHERSHTNEKPFLCAFCGRCFARRDLVLRHQQKLHASLMDQDKNPDIIMASKEVKVNYSARHIIKKPGNKETVLPTPAMSVPQLEHTMSMGSACKTSSKQLQVPLLPNLLLPLQQQQQQQQSPDEQQHSSVHSEDPNPHAPKKRKRHASFSASTNISYTQRKDVPQLFDTEQNNVPHQVGFSTPQLTAQELTDKALESGLNIDFLEPPEFMLSDPSVQPNLKPKQPGVNETTFNRNSQIPPGESSSKIHNASQRNDGMQLDLGQVSKDLHNKHQFPAGLTPLISDMLTMRSATAGVGGFVDLNAEQNLDYFNYKDNNDEPHHGQHLSAGANRMNIQEPDNYKQKETPTTANTTSTVSGFHSQNGNADGSGVCIPNMSTSHKQTSELIHEFISNMGPQNPEVQHDNKTSSNINTQQHFMKGQDSQRQDQVLDLSGKRTSSQQQQQQHLYNPEDEHWLSEFINTQIDGNFKVNMTSFNEIGFPATTSSHRNSFSISSNTQHSSPSKNAGPLNAQQMANTQLPQALPNSKFTIGSPKFMRDAPTSAPLSKTPSQSFSPDISTLFKSRQVDLFKKIMDKNGIATPGLSPNSISNGAKPKKGTRLVFFDEVLRQKILLENNLLSTQFPTLEELNTYANLYQDEFHMYFPFIHLHSIKPSMRIYPLLLSICVIGALYGFHSSHAMLLFNISRFHIREYLERTKDHHHETPLWVIQSMVLLIFLGIFNNDMSITQTMNTQIMSLIELVKLKQLNLPLENIMPLPIESDHILEYQDYPELQEQIRKQYRTKEQMEKNFQYFIKAQSRIRTCHTILLISNLFTSLVGLDCCFHSIDLKCGIPCYNEQLYFCENSVEWTELLKNDNIELDSKFSLIQLSNGDETYKNCLIYLTNGHQFFYDNKKVSFKTLLSLLISIHEKIFLERYHLKRETNIQIIEMKWRMHSRPIIESLIKFWEALYLKNGGILQPNENNIELINNNPALRLIIPLHSFAKMRKCISLTSVMNKIWLKDWQAMNIDLENSFSDWDSLREATDYGLNIVKFWIDTVSIVKNAEKTSIRTPIFSITCIFSAILTIAEFLKRMERKALTWKHNQLQPTSNASNSTSFMNYVDRTIWLKSEMILKKVETHLLPKGYNMQSYAEFLRIQANGALDVEVLDDELAKRAMDPNTDIHETMQVVQRARLSSRSLYLGVRILGDAPIWPIALLFAHALQARAIYNVSHPSQYQT